MKELLTKHQQVARTGESPEGYSGHGGTGSTRNKMAKGGHAHMHDHLPKHARGGHQEVEHHHPHDHRGGHHHDKLGEHGEYAFPKGGGHHDGKGIHKFSQGGTTRHSTHGHDISEMEPKHGHEGGGGTGSTRNRI